MLEDAGGDSQRALGFFACRNAFEIVTETIVQDVLEVCRFVACHLLEPKFPYNPKKSTTELDYDDAWIFNQGTSSRGSQDTSVDHALALNLGYRVRQEPCRSVRMYVRTWNECRLGIRIYIIDPRGYDVCTYK